MARMTKNSLTAYFELQNWLMDHGLLILQLHKSTESNFKVQIDLQILQFCYFYNFR